MRKCDNKFVCRMMQFLLLLMMTMLLMVCDGVNGQLWVQRYDDIDGETIYDHSGAAVAISADGDVVAVGALDAAAGTGQVRVFRDDGTAWVQLGDDIDGQQAGEQAVIASCRGKTPLLGLIDCRVGRVGVVVGRWADCCNWCAFQQRQRRFFWSRTNLSIRWQPVDTIGR
jgi:hypothetical protein